MKYAIFLSLSAVLFLCACDEPDEYKLIRYEANLAEEHYKYHKKNEFDFSKECSECGNKHISAHMVINSQKRQREVNAMTAAVAANTVVMATSMARR